MYSQYLQQYKRIEYGSILIDKGLITQVLRSRALLQQLRPLDQEPINNGIEELPSQGQLLYSTETLYKHYVRVAQSKEAQQKC